MTRRTFEDPVIELAMRLGGPERVLDFADTTSQEAEDVLQLLGEVEEQVGDFRSRLRHAGHVL